MARAWNARACHWRAAATAYGRFDRIIVRRFKKVHNVAVESTVCRRSGSQIALRQHPSSTQA
eukprot:2304881-Lingulodinium_polyedra.AAC.1